MARKRVSRRTFLGSSATAAAASLTGCSSNQGTQKEVSQTSGLWERPPDQRDKGNRRNLIFLNVDTFRADNLQCYGGNGLVHCPRLDRFSEGSVIFDDVYPEGMPTIPIRRVLMTGRRIVPYYYYHQHEPVQLPGWHDLYYEDQTVAETLHEAGYTTALIADIPHMQRPGRNFHRGYRYYEWARGHEADYYAQARRQMPDFRQVFPQSYLDRPELAGYPQFLNQFLANRERYTQHAGSVIEQTANNVIAWLKGNHDQGPFFLHMEAFDPHEPWDPPEEFLKQYAPYSTEHTWWEPPYANIEVPEEGVQRLRANYAGESSCVDHWLGEIFKTIEDLGLYENSVVVFFSDHGALLGEQGQFLKGPERIRGQVTHNPFLARVPGDEHAGKHVKGFVHHPDVMPTLFHLLDLQPPPRATGQNCWPLVTGETGSIHEHLVHAYGWVGAVRTAEWSFNAVFDEKRYPKPEGYAPQLYELESDPQELNNVAESYPDVVADLKGKMRDYIESGAAITQGNFGPPKDYQPT